MSRRSATAGEERIVDDLGGPGPIAVTGSAGYVGSRLVHHLGQERVRALVRKPVSYLPSRAQQQVDLLAGTEDLAAALDGAQAVVHLAGHNEVVATHEPVRALTETLRATEHLIAAARAVGIERMVYLSTIHVYGAQIVDGALLSEDTPPSPLSTYAVSRFACEHLLEHSDLDVVVLRLSNALGAPAAPEVDRWTLVAADLCRSAALGRPLTLRTSGLQSRDFIALTDVCEIIDACSRPGDVAAGTYNLGTGTPTTVRALAEQVATAFEARTGRRPQLHAPAPDGPPPSPYRVAVERLAAQGLRAGDQLADALDELVGFCLDHKDAL